MEAMQTLITGVTTVGEAIWGQIGTIGSTIVETPVLLFTMGFLFVGGCVGIFGRLLSRN